MATAPELLSSAPELQIRPMRAGDLAEVVAVERASYQFPWSEGIFRDCLRVGYTCRVVALERQLLAYGVMSVGAGEAHVLNLCVADAMRCRGVGKRLLRSLLDRALEAGMSEAFLEVRPSNTAAIRLYLACGFDRWACDAATTRRSAAARMRPCSGSHCEPPAYPPADAPGGDMSDLPAEIRRRRTFAIISHPDAGKTTLTEKLLLFGGAIQMAGTVKGRKAARHATSDWMRLEQQRGISVTSSVMQFPYRDCIVNLLDTPGHEDFSEDTYRTLTAVDSALMVIDCAKGVEERTIKLMEVCRLRDTPIMTFINKLDRDGRPPIELLDEIESVLQHRHRAGHLADRHGARAARHLSPRRGPHLRLRGRRARPRGREPHHRRTRERGGARVPGRLARRPSLRRSSWSGARPRRSTWRRTAPAGRRRCSSAPPSTTSASRSCSRRSSRDAPGPLPRAARERIVEPLEEPALTGFVFKIQANMDPAHRDRIAFLRLCSGRYARGMRLFHVRLGKEVRVADALTFMAADRAQAEEAYAGDIIGLHNHGTINIGDTFTQGERLTFTGVPNFAPGDLPPRGAQGSAEDEGAAEGPVAAVRGGRDAAVPAAAQQRADPGRGRAAAVRGGGVSPAGRVRRAVRVRAGDGVHRALGRRRRARRSSRSSARAPTSIWRSITPARWCTSRPRASICS